MVPIRKIIYLVLALLWMIIIFWYSSQPGPESKDYSSKYAYFVCEHLLPGHDDLTAEEQEICLQKTDHIIRKMAHFAEYAILGFLVAGIFISREIKGKKLARFIITAWLIVALYAVSDEYHQLYVPGRSGQFSDVIIDSCGALAGVLVYWVCIRFMFRKERNVEKSI